MRSDVEIQRAILRELRWDTRVDETDVGVEVDKGIVTLTGTVDSNLKRTAAQRPRTERPASSTSPTTSRFTIAESKARPTPRLPRQYAGCWNGTPGFRTSASGRRSRTGP
jgi:hypothetical protein